MAKKRRTKLRSSSQRIGESGENLFRAWATQLGLSPTKPDHDYGVDFFCSVFRRLEDGHEAITGSVLSVQVRSTSAREKQRVTLGRSDAEIALRIDTPYVLAAVNVSKNQIRFRFMDEAFAEELHAFLQSDACSHSVTFKSMDTGNSRFAETLAEVCRPAFQQRLRWTKARLDVSAVVPGSRLAFRRDDEGGVVLVTTPFITSAFAVLPEHQDEAARLVFEEGHPPDDFAKFGLHPQILSLNELVGGHIYIAGPFERQSKLSVETPGFPRVTVTVGVRSIGDEIGYVLKTGLYLAFSGPRMRKGQHVHEFRHGIAKGDAVELKKAGEEFGFLKALREGSSLVIDDGSPMPIDHWGDLKYLGSDLEALERAYGHLGLSMEGLLLADAVEHHVLVASGLIAAFLNGVGLQSVLPGFVYEEPIHGNLQEHNWKPCVFKMPIVMNLRTVGVVLWSLGKGSVYEHEDLICGFRPERQDRWEVDVREEPFAGVTIPELWVCETWPPIPLDIHERGQSVSVEYKKKLPFGGEFYKPGNSTGEPV